MATYDAVKRKENYARSKEHDKIKRKERYQRNRVSELKGAKEYAERNKERCSERRKLWRQSLAGRMKAVKKCAKDRNMTFDLSDEELARMLTSPCTYCGVKGKIIGVDREDNSRGYAKGNCVSACWNCNKMKGTLDKAEWFQQLVRIVTHLKLLNFRTMAALLLDHTKGGVVNVQERDGTGRNTIGTLGDTPRGTHEVEREPETLCTSKNTIEGFLARIQAIARGE